MVLATVVSAENASDGYERGKEHRDQHSLVFSTVQGDWMEQVWLVRMTTTICARSLYECSDVDSDTAPCDDLEAYMDEAVL